MYCNHGSDSSPLTYSIGSKQVTDITHTEEEEIIQGMDTRKQGT